jgi:hypothetical protein
VLLSLSGLIVRTITVSGAFGGAGNRGYNALSDERAHSNPLCLG